jgi:hypothetical protein
MASSPVFWNTLRRRQSGPSASGKSPPVAGGFAGGPAAEIQGEEGEGFEKREAETGSGGGAGEDAGE